MIANLTPYPAYKASGMGWLKAVPEHWEIRTIKTLFREKDARSRDGKGMLLSLTRAGGIVPHSEVSTKPATASDLSKYKLCIPGDLVMNRMQAWSGMFAVSPYCGLVSPDYSVFTPMTESAIRVQFFERLFKTPMFVDQFAKRSKGIGSGFNRLYTPDFGSVHALSPPVTEQAAIVRFFDHADRRIRRYIRAKERLIELLEEQKQAIIHQAVTGQIDVRTGQPYPAYKDSGLAWPAKVPEHWQVGALKWVLDRLVDCEHKTAPTVDESQYRVVRTTAVRRGILQWEGTYCTSEEAFVDWTKRARLEPGDVVFTREAPVGEACVVPEGTQVCLGQRTVLMRPMRDEYDPDFLVHMIYGGPPRDHVRLASQGTTVGHFNMDDIGSMWVLKPPFDEQLRLVNEIGRRKRALDLAVARTERQVSLLHEYRTRLIADVVTGKLDVREAAAAMPEELDAPADAMETIDLENATERQEEVAL